jgi:hypothetical protein
LPQHQEYYIQCTLITICIFTLFAKALNNLDSMMTSFIRSVTTSSMKQFNQPFTFLCVAIALRFSGHQNPMGYIRRFGVINLNFIGPNLIYCPHSTAKGSSSFHIQIVFYKLLFNSCNLDISISFLYILTFPFPYNIRCSNLRHSHSEWKTVLFLRKCETFSILSRPKEEEEEVEKTEKITFRLSY